MKMKPYNILHGELQTLQYNGGLKAGNRQHINWNKLKNEG